jgi:zinc and cadmium transporter
MNTLTWILIATVANSLISLVGVFTLSLSKEKINKIIFAMVGFSAGAMLSGAFFHLISESIEMFGDTTQTFIFVFAGFIAFFVIERALHWHHCHDGNCPHQVTYLILLGDGLHNFIDGMVIAASFLVGTGFGIVTTILIMGHELPQEIGDFGVLLHGGFERRKALFYNFLSQAASIVGGVLGFFLSGAMGITQILLPFAAGGFIYIAASDLVPEFHREGNLKKTAGYFVFFLLGIGFMLGLKLALGN